MQGNTERRKKKTAPVAAAVLVIVYILPLVTIAVLAMMDVIRLGGGALPVLFVLIYLAVGGAVIGGVLAAMGQRLREIDGGEEEDASQY